MDQLPTVGVLAIVSFGILLLTELTSNTATAATFLPMLNVLLVPIVVALLLLLGPMVFDLQMGVIPAWAK